MGLGGVEMRILDLNLRWNRFPSCHLAPMQTPMNAGGAGQRGNFLASESPLYGCRTDILQARLSLRFGFQFASRPANSLVHLTGQPARLPFRSARLTLQPSPPVLRKPGLPFVHPTHGPLQLGSHFGMGRAY